MYFVSSRYYVSEWGRFIQPIDPIGLSLTNINGLNLYGYGSNNPVKKTYKSKTNLNEGINSNISNFRNNLSLNSYKENAQNMKFLMDLKTEWFSLEIPKILYLDNNDIVLASGSFTLVKTDLHINEEDMWSIYLSLVNISTKVNYDIKKRDIFYNVSGELISIGYDGLFVEASVNLLGLGYGIDYNKKGEFGIKANMGLIGGTLKIKYERIIYAFLFWIFGDY